MTEYEYKILSTDDEVLRGNQPTSSSQLFPGTRRTYLGAGVPNGSVLVKTGGNALQALDQQSASSENFVSAVVPKGVEPGESMLVACPDGRMVSITIPPASFPGHVLLVQIPPLGKPVEPVDPIVVTGIPVQNTNPTGTIVSTDESDLDLNVEVDSAGHDFEMVPRKRDVV